MEEQRVYKLHRGSRFQGGAKVNINKIGERLSEITDRDGGNLTPEAVVEDGRDERSPFHTLFEWNETEAARQWNLQQARGIIGSVMVTVPVINHNKPLEEPREVTVRNFIENPISGKNGYESLRVVLADAVKRDSLLAQAWRELQAWQSEYQTLQELADVFAITESLRPIINEKIRELEVV
jgi:hypothetical protein